MKRSMALIVLALLSLSGVWAAIPSQLNYQGYLTGPTGTPLDTVVQVQFTLYDLPAGGTTLWTETQTACSVRAGIFAVTLGAVTALPLSAFSAADVYFGVAVGGDAEMTPRSKVSSAAFSYRVGTVDGALGGTISGTLKADTLNPVTGIRFADSTFQRTALDSGSFATRSWVWSNGYLSGTHNVIGNHAFVGGGDQNAATGAFSVIAGGGGIVAGDYNQATGLYSTISGGTQNHATGYASTIAGGIHSTADADYGTVGGGSDNRAAGMYATASGGKENWATGTSATVSGGDSNRASGNKSVVAGGFLNLATGDFAVIAGGGGNSPSDGNHAGGLQSTVSGGVRNLADSALATVGGGSENHATGVSSTISGGGHNTVTAILSTISGGWGNTVSGQGGVVGGGRYNNASGAYATIGGGGGGTTTESNAATGIQSTIAGGTQNYAGANYATIGGGLGNYATGQSGVVGGGSYNNASGAYATIGGGGGGTLGTCNTAMGSQSTIAGGTGNWATTTCAAIGGGGTNQATGTYSTIPGGLSNVAGGSASFAAGRQANANHDGAFVWADFTAANFASTSANQFNVRASGGYRLYSNTTLTSGVTMAAGASGWTNVSDSTLKRNRRNVDTRSVLDKICQMPIQQWSYKAQSPNVEHIGPMAQDFWRQFHLGDDSLGINEIDPAGISLAAIQELAKRCDALGQQNALLQTQLQALIASGNKANKEK